MNIVKLLYLSLLSCMFQIAAKQKLVLFIPFDEYDTHDRIFEGGMDNYWYQLKHACAQAGFILTTRRDRDPKKVYAIVAFNAPQQDIMSRYKDAKKILYMWEPPTIHPLNFSKRVHAQYDYIATWHDKLIDGKKYHKFNYALLFNAPQQLRTFKQKKLCCMFVGNKRSAHPDELYSQRLAMVQFLEQHAPAEFDLYGPGWPTSYRTYRGFAQDKIAVMKNYKFAIVYENMCNIPGYITEKIFDAFSAGCVPVYWGASNIAHHIPADCFIAREKFASDAAVYEFLKTMSEEEYNGYSTAIRNFVSSEKAYLFSRERYIETFIELLRS